MMSPFLHDTNFEDQHSNVLQTGDNIFNLFQNCETTASRSKSLHWTHAFAVKNRVNPDSMLNYDKPRMQVTDLEMCNILPSELIRKRSAVIWSHLFTGKLLNLCPVMLLSSPVYSTIFYIHILRKCKKNQIRYC